MAERIAKMMPQMLSDGDFFLSVIIPTFRRFKPLLDTVEDILSQDWSDYEIIVLDQNAEWPREYKERQASLSENSRVKWFYLENPGVVKARNEGAAAARGDILVFIDDDVVIEDRGFLRRHAANYGDPKIAAVAGRECQRGTTTRQIGEASPMLSLEQTPAFCAFSRLDEVFSFSRECAERVLVHTFCTCNGSIRTSVFKHLGGFDENFSGNSYGDDYDLALRMSDEGLVIVYDPCCWLVHLQAPLGGLRLSDQDNPSKERDRAVSTCVFVLKHFEWRYAYTLIIKHLLRKTVLRRDNVLRPWRQPVAWYGLLSGLAAAWRSVSSGPCLPFRK